MVLMIVGAFVTLSIVFQTWIFVKLWFIPFLFSIPTHALVELPEHFGCNGQTPDVLKNTRSIRAGRFLIWFTNGNNYHAEHHWLPSVPTDKLEEVHRESRERDENITKSLTGLSIESSSRTC